MGMDIGLLGLIKMDVRSALIKFPFILLQKSIGRAIKPIKISKKIIIFTNLYYTGNPRAVYERFLEQHELLKKYDVYWMTSNLGEFLKLRREGKPVLYKHGLLSVKIYKAADLWVLAHIGPQNVPFVIQKDFEKLKKLQLWHGVGPKGINFTKEDYENYYFCVSSEYTKKRHIQLWNAPPDKLLVTGTARLDTLYKYLKTPRSKLLKELKIKSNNKIVLYAPTFDTGLWPWREPYEEFEKLCMFCKENDLTLILRLHPYAKVNRKKIKKIVRKYPNVHWLDMSKEPDTMKLLAITDILVTDWSSLYTEYFLILKPIIFLEVEYHKYVTHRGKSQIPPEFRAGEIVRSNSEFYDALKIVLEKGNRYSDKQKELLKTIHGDVNEIASLKVIKAIENLTRDS